MTLCSFARLMIGVSFLTAIAGCNRQPNATEAPMVAPPAAALPLAGGPPPPIPLAPAAAALPPAPTPVRYAPLPAHQGYGYIDQAAWMSQAFADTPPDYAVNYEGTRPWIWRAGDGAYRIVERMPQGERYFYYRSGEDYPFLVRDPDYSYAYDNGDLVSVYGPDGAELDNALAAQRAAEASRYFYRARQLYRAAQYQQRQSAYASAWAENQRNIQRQNDAWQRQQVQNADWRSWHDAHVAQEQQQWRGEQQQRSAYAAAIGVIAAGARGAVTPPDPSELARRQAALFARTNAARVSPTVQAPATRSASVAAPRIAPPVALSNPTPQAANQNEVVEKPSAAATQARIAAAAQAQRQAANAAQRNVAAAQARSAQAALAQRSAAQAQHREAAAGKAKAAAETRAQMASSQAEEHQAAAAHANSARAAETQRVEAAVKQREASAAHAKAAQAASAETAAAVAKQRAAGEARVKAAEANAAERAAANAKAREAAAAHAKAAETARAPHVQAEPQRPNRAVAANANKPAPDKPKRRGPKDQEQQKPQ